MQRRWTGDLGVLTTHETSPWFPLGDVGSRKEEEEEEEERPTSGTLIYKITSPDLQRIVEIKAAVAVVVPT